jgi:two-component system chemotaxis sensor kinase CheA
MMPINFVFSRFPRVVRDLASKLGKKIQLKTVGEGTELDKGLIEKISDPLTHLVRNSLDHGIELPEERIAKGKDPQGTITLKAAHQGGNIVIEVEDDGAGLNREKILAKAREKGIPFNDNISDADVWLMIFAPGFSTAEIVTDVSGRGVGMDVVKRNIDSISGRVEVTSRQGQGCTVTIRLPLTLAILDGLSIAVGDQIYIVPLSFISESLQPGATDIKNINGQGQVVHVRGEYVPVIALHQVFNIKPKVTKPEEGILVLLEAEGKKVALFVDALVGQHQVVIKSLETNYRKVAGMSGATIMGDGRVAMIMDVAALVKLAQK